MNISVLKQASLASIPSASAVEVINGNIYVVGDDSRYLYMLKYDLTLLAKIALYETPEPDDLRIAKKKKADLECIAHFSINGYPHLLVLGSGSLSPQREMAFLIKLPTPYNRKHLVWPVNLSKWYAFLRMNEEATGASGVLNFEAAACDESYFYLCNRENNAILRFDLPEFIEFIQGHTEGVPFPTIIPTVLPDIDGCRAGISGADHYDGRLFITASAEETSNAIDDGEVKGSAAGILSFSGGEKIRGRYNEAVQVALEDFARIPDTGDKRLKIESISIYEKENDKTYIGVAVSDDDKGGSDILMLQIDLD